MSEQKNFTVYLPSGDPVWEDPIIMFRKASPTKDDVHGGMFGGKRTSIPVKDLVTDTVYQSKSACGRALAHLIGGDPTDHFVWYKLQSAFPDRFIEI